MATPRADYVDLPGSERVPHAFATVNQQQPVDPEERATVTIVPAYAEAVPAILAFATEHHLTASLEHGLVKVAGRLGDLQAAFDVRLAPAVTETGVRFRNRACQLRW
jgi:hypothetical protein